MLGQPGVQLRHVARSEFLELHGADVGLDVALGDYPFEVPGAGISAASLVPSLPVFLDANVPANLGAGTNEDGIIMARFDHDLLFESDAPTVGVYDGVLSANLQVRIMV